MSINPIKNIAQLCNIALLLLLLFLAASRGWPTSDDWLFLILFITTPVANLIALHGAANNSSWFALYFKRKALEEEKKIEELTKQK